MREERFFTVLKILLEQEGFVTVDRLALDVGVSPKTIRLDLLRLEEWLAGRKLTLVKKTGQGVLLEGSIQKKLEIRQEIRQEGKGEEDFSPQSRVHAIAMMLLARGEEVWVHELAENLYASRATIQHDLKWVTELLGKYKIQLHRKKNRGLTVEGKERRIRTCLADLLLNSPEVKNLRDLVVGVDDLRDEDRPFSSLSLTAADARKFLGTLQSAEHPFLSGLPLQAFITVFLMTAISYLRYTQGHGVELSSEFMASLAEEPFYEEVEKMAEKIKEGYGVTLPEVEKRFLQVYFVSQTSSGIHVRRDEEEARWLAQNLADQWEKALHLELKDKPLLLRSLTIHLIPCITRFRHGIYVENPILGEIKKLHRQTYRIVEESRSLLEERYGTAVSEDELGFLTLHLAAALDRMKEPLKTLLVSHVGLGAQNLLEERLTREIPEIAVTDRANAFTVHDRTLTDYEVILSTMALKLSGNPPVIQISPLLHNTDIPAIRNLLKPLFDAKNDPRGKKRSAKS